MSNSSEVSTHTDREVDGKIHDELKKYAEYAIGLTPWPGNFSYTQPDLIAVETGWASFRSQEEIAGLTEELIKHNRRLANATIGLALVTFVLVLVTALHL